MGREDRVAALCANSHVMLELHYAVPALGAALVTVNVRLSAAEMAEILDHSGAPTVLTMIAEDPAAGALDNAVHTAARVHR